MRSVAGEALTFSESDLQIYEPNCYIVEKAISLFGGTTLFEKTGLLSVPLFEATR